MNLRTVLLAAIAVTLIAVLAGLARTSRDWAVVAKVALGIVGFAALLAGLYLAYDRIWDQPHVVQSLHGIELGLPRGELPEALGTPVAGRSHQGNPWQVLYYETGSRRLMIRLGPTSSNALGVVTICSNEGPVATGISPFSHRSTVIDRLGEPDIAVGDPRISEWLLFTNWRFAVKLRKERVELMCATDEESLGFNADAEQMERAIRRSGGSAIAR